VLQGLTFQPTGAVVAAPTTSLPERVGGARNWDYRYAWVRDASLTLRALWVAACPDEAFRFFEWMAHAASARLLAGDDLQIMFGVGGEHDLSERTLPHLSGWRDSRPVRVGNEAWRQPQLDIYGELLDAAWRLADVLGDLGPVTRGLLVAAADAAATRWRERDHGLWEVRGEPAHFLHSKLMCWQAVHRAIELAPRLGAADRVPAWTRAREDLRAALLTQGWDPRVGAFTQAFGRPALDASALLIPISGFLPADDPRVRSTIDAIATRLADARGLLRRYHPDEVDDGVGGPEGAFLPCTFWLAHALALAGDLPRARDTFERAAACANDLGLLAEEVDPGTGELIGNFPQAFSHIALVDAAWAIQQAGGFSA
jgi:GH15 family glucan-1,4-alpha-glucosidase